MAHIGTSKAHKVTSRAHTRSAKIKKSNDFAQVGSARPDQVSACINKVTGLARKGTARLIKVVTRERKGTVFERMGKSLCEHEVDVGLRRPVAKRDAKIHPEKGSRVCRKKAQKAQRDL